VYDAKKERIISLEELEVKYTYQDKENKCTSEVMHFSCPDCFKVLLLLLKACIFTSRLSEEMTAILPC